MPLGLFLASLQELCWWFYLPPFLVVSLVDPYQIPQKLVQIVGFAYELALWK
jgi:hypothetical protein